MLRIASHPISGFADHIMPAWKVRPTMPATPVILPKRMSEALTRNLTCSRKEAGSGMLQAQSSAP
jgi:hypothetical protein